MSLRNAIRTAPYKAPHQWWGMRLIILDKPFYDTKETHLQSAAAIMFHSRFVCYTSFMSRVPERHKLEKWEEPI